MSSPASAVSVVIPTYNRARFLGAALESVYAQTMPVAEIIVVDDGSTDDTPAVVSAHAGRIRYFRQRNRGPSAARNLGIQTATGTFVAFLDSDDMWTPATIATLVCAFHRNPRLGLATADTAAIDEFGAVLESSWLARGSMAEEIAALNGASIPNAVARLISSNFVSTSLVMVPRKIAIEVGGFAEDIRFAEDLLMWVQIASRHPVVCLPVILGLRRIHSGNMTRSTEALMKDQIRVAERIRATLGEVLVKQGEFPGRYVRGTYNNLGYWYFAGGQMANAQQAFLAAFRSSPNIRSLIYLICSLLPASFVDGIRAAKRRLIRRQSAPT